MADEKPTVTDKASPLEMEKVKHSSLEYAVQHDGPAYRQRAVAPYKESALPELTRGEAAKLFFRVRRPVTRAHVRITVDGATALEGKPRSFIPSIMESFPLPAKLAAAAKESIEISVIEEDDDHE